MSAMQPIKRSDLDPLALDLGLAANVLLPDGSDQVTVNQDWFNDPLGKSAKGLRTNGRDLAALLAAIFGQVEGNALAIPSDDPAALGTWYPIGKPGAKAGDPPTGLYIVTYAQGAEQVFGLGVKHVWGVGGGQNGSAIEVTAFGILPVLRSGPAEANDIGAMLVLGSKDNPMMLGIAASSPSGPILAGAGLSLGGGRLLVQISFDPDQPVTVSLDILQLQLPGDAKPADRSLADLETITSQQLLSTVAALLITGLTQLTGQNERTQYLMPLFGLSPLVPGVDGVQLPLLDWVSLATQAGQNDVAKPFRDWFNALASDPANLKAWLACVSGLLCAPGTPVTGTGARNDPFAAPIVLVGASGALSLTMASLVDANGARVVYPGLGVSSPKFAIGSSDIVVVLTSALELFQFTLVENGSSAVSSLRFDAGMQLVNNTAGQPLYNGGGYNIGYLTAGLELTSDLAVIPSFLLVDVQTPQGQYANSRPHRAEHAGRCRRAGVARCHRRRAATASRHRSEFAAGGAFRQCCRGSGWLRAADQSADWRDVAEPGIAAALLRGATGVFAAESDRRARQILVATAAAGRGGRRQAALRLHARRTRRAAAGGHREGRSGGGDGRRHAGFALARRAVDQRAAGLSLRLCRAT